MKNSNTIDLLKIRLKFLRKRVVEVSDPLELSHYLGAYQEVLTLLGVIVNSDNKKSADIYMLGIDLTKPKVKL